MAVLRRVALALTAASVTSVPLVNAAFLRKATPLDKVITLLEDLRTKVTTEGEAEAKTYNVYACFCKDTMASKLAAIEAGTAEKDTLQARLNEAAADRDTEDEAIDTAVTAISDKEKELNSLHALRHQAALEYEKNEVDLTGAIQALTSAIHELKAAQTGTASFAQLSKSGQLSLVRRALVMAEVLNPAASQKASVQLSALQEAPFEIPTEDYSFHSTDIIGTIEQLKEDFKTQKNTLDSDEVAAKQTYDTEVQNAENEITIKQGELETARTTKAEKVTLIETTSADLTTTSATLADDKAYASDLSAKCNAKAVLWDQRSQLRVDELNALTAALGVMQSSVVHGDDSSLVQEAPRQAAAPAAFFQTARVARHSQRRAWLPKALIGRRAQAAALLRTRAKTLKSALLLKLANEAADSADPFEKVKVMIQELIERLLTEAAEEASHKGWCDKEVGLAEQSRDTNAKEVQTLNSAMGVAEAHREKLTSMIQTLDKEITEIDTISNETVAMRDDEKAQNAKTVEEAQAAADAVAEAITALEQFYGTASNSKLSLLQAAPTSTTVEEDIPDAGFDDVYTGAQGGSTGVIGMLEVVQSDFARTVSDTQKAEAAAEADFLEFQKTSGISLAEKSVAVTEHTTALNSADAEYQSDSESLASHQSLLDKAIQEMGALQSACFDGGQTDEEKKANREEEIASLKEALTILESQ